MQRHLGMGDDVFAPPPPTHTPAPPSPPLHTQTPALAQTHANTRPPDHTRTQNRHALAHAQAHFPIHTCVLHTRANALHYVVDGATAAVVHRRGHSCRRALPVLLVQAKMLKKNQAKLAFQVGVYCSFAL